MRYNFSKNKFGSKKKKDKPTLDGYIFDSGGELKRYIELSLLKKAGEIEDLVVHPKYVLFKASINNCNQKVSAWTYKPDFSYYDISRNERVVEDVKSLRISTKNGKSTKYGTATLRDYKLTRNQFMRCYPDIYFNEVYY